jgi:hypothetical protein
MQVFRERDLAARVPTQPRSPVTPEPHRLSVVDPREGGRRSVWLAVRVLGALSLLAVGAVHLQQFFTLYSSIPTIGTLFVLNFAGATVLGLGLLAPLGRLLGRRGDPVLVLLALGGIALAATAFVFLLISEHTPLFGFMEPGYDPPAILASRVAEAATVLSLGGLLTARLVRKAPIGSW